MSRIEPKAIYLDDAGHPVDKPFLVIGGCISTERRWADFEGAWEAVLKRLKLSVPFHATDFFGEHKKNPKLKYMTADLVRTIGNHVEGAYSVGLDVDAYKKINQEKRLEECAGAPIAMISRVLRGNVDFRRRLTGDESPLRYFIERGTFQRGDMDDCWKYLDGLTPPITVSKAHPSAQAADLYAYSVYKSAPFNKLSWQHQMFFNTFQYKDVYLFDGRVMESDMRESLARKTSVVDGQRTSIPNRKATEGLDFSFKNNPNKKQNIRKAKIGMGET